MTSSLPTRGANHQDTIIMMAKAGATYAEIGEAIGMSGAAVGSCIKRARRAGVEVPRRNEVRLATQPTVASDGFGARAILGLEAGHCRWPMGELENPSFHFCADAKDPGQSYCSFHKGISRGRP